MRDATYGYGTMYQRLAGLNIKPSFEFSLWILARDEVRCSDFTPAHVIVIEASPKISDRFWDGWPPPPPPPPRSTTRDQVVLRDPFAKRRRGAAAAGDHLAPIRGDAVDPASLDDPTTPDAATPIGEAPKLPVDGENEHGRDANEADADQDDGGEQLENLLLDLLLAGADAAAANSVPSDVDAPPESVEPSVVRGLPAAEEEAKAGHLEQL